MKELFLPDDGIELLLETHRDVSRARTAEDAKDRFVLRARQLLGLEYFVDACTIGLGPGEFQLMDRLFLPDGDLTFEQARGNNRWAEHPNVPIQRGGFIGEVVTGSSPRVFTDLDVPDDPVLGQDLAGFRSCLAVPVFHEGEVGEWVLMFWPGDFPLSTADVRFAVQGCNMLAQSILQHLLLDDVKRLNARLHDEMEELGRVQRSLLPKALPRTSGLELAAGYRPCEAAGGDYYDYCWFTDGRLGLVVADVAGHGAAASVVMAMLRTTMSFVDAHGRPPDRVIPDVNGMLLNSLARGRFVTACFVILDPHSGDFRQVSCGHPPARIRRMNGRVESLAPEGSPPLGILPELEGPSVEGRLSPGDVLVLYTDGIVEAFDSQKEMFGVRRLDQVLSNVDGSASEVVAAIESAVDRHVSGAQRTDDQCVLALRYRSHDTEGAPVGRRQSARVSVKAGA